MRSSWRTSTTRSTTSSLTVITAKFGIMWSSSWKSQRNGRIGEVSVFHLRHCCKTKICRARIRTLCWNLLVRYRNCKMKVIAWMIQGIFRMLNQFSVEIPTLPIDQCPPHPIPEGMLSRSCGMLSRREGPRQAFVTHMVHWETFLQIQMRLVQHFIRRNWIHGVPEEKSRFTHLQLEKSERQTQDQDQRCQSGQSAHNSVMFCGGDSWRNYGTDQQRLQISDLHFDKFPAPATFACWKMRFNTEVCSCSQFLTEAMQWNNEVEMVATVDDLMSSSSTRGIQMPNIEVLDARIASALKRIIHNSHFKRRDILEEQKAQKQDRFVRGRQIAYLDKEYFRVTRSSDSVENFSDPFTIGLRNVMIFKNSTQSGTKSSIVYDENPTWWHLGRIVHIQNTSVWETQDCSGIVWLGDSSQENITWLW